MSDFETWFRRQAIPVEVELPEGITEGPDGVYQAKCCCCDRWDEIPVGIDEIPATGYEHYCGGSPRCCP